MIVRAMLGAAAALLVAGRALAAPAVSVAYVGAHASRDSDLWQEYGDRPLEITVAGARIERVIPLDPGRPAQATDIDVAGLTVLPGLIDAHTHHATEPNLDTARRQLAAELHYGITTVRDMAGDVRLLAELERESLAGEIAAPDLRYSALVAGADFFADPRTHAASAGLEPGSVAWMRAVDERSSPDEVIAEAKGSGATGLKIYANLTAPVVRALIDAGRRAHFPVWTHLAVYPAGPFDALGATSVSHVCMLARAVMEPGKQRYGHADEPDYTGFDTLRREVTEYGRALAASGTVLDATLSVYPVSRPASGRGCDRALAGRLVTRLVALGVTVAAGTDHDAEPGSPAALDDELRALVAVGGLSPAEALRAATSGSAAALGARETLGRLAAGYTADAVFYRSDPAAGLDVLRHPVRVVHRGLDVRLDDAARAKQSL